MRASIFKGQELVFPAGGGVRGGRNERILRAGVVGDGVVALFRERALTEALDADKSRSQRRTAIFFCLQYSRFGL